MEGRRLMYRVGIKDLMEHILSNINNSSSILNTLSITHNRSSLSHPGSQAAGVKAPPGPE